MSETQRLLFIFFMIAACSIAAALAYRAFQLRRKVYWAFAFVVMSAGSIIWLLANTSRLISTAPAVWIVSTCAGGLGLSLAVFGLMVFSIQISNRVRKIPAYLLAAYIPLLSIFLLLLWTNGFHHWFYLQWPLPGRDSQPLSLLNSLFLLVLYTQIAISLAVLGRSFLMRDGIFRAQTGLLLVGVIIPAIVGLAEDYLNGDIFYGVDEAALAIVITIGIFALATLRFGSFTVIPVAYKLMVDNLQDGLVVLDLDDQIVTRNPSAIKFFGDIQNTKIGVPFGVALSRWSSEAQAAWSVGKEEFDITLNSGIRQSFRLSARDLVEGKSESAGKLVMIYDITEQKQLETRLHEMAINDPLTGCFNRGHFMECAGKQFRQAMRYHRPLSVAMIDLDHFKRVNDEFGHTTGDKVLKRVASACLAALRRSDIFARFGGEEFVVMMPETESTDAVLVAERLRESIRGQVIQNVSITASVGVARLDPDEDIDLERLLDRADRALYRSKELGRDRVTLWKK